MKKWMFVLLLGLLVAGGCTHNLTTLTDEEVFARTTTASMGRLSPEGNISTAYQGIGGSGYQIDPEGIYGFQQGASGQLVFPIIGSEGEKAFMSSPKNAKVVGFVFEYNPETKLVKMSIESLELNISEPYLAMVEGLRIALPELKGMTEIEAKARIEQWVEIGKISQQWADTLTGLLPLLIAP